MLQNFTDGKCYEKELLLYFSLCLKTYLIRLHVIDACLDFDLVSRFVSSLFA